MAFEQELISSLYDKESGGAAVTYKDALQHAPYQKDLALSFPKDVATPFLVTDILEDPYRYKYLFHQT
jgi:hypothetical protein